MLPSGNGAMRSPGNGRSKTEITGVTEKDGGTVVTATVSGNFEGSPASLDYHFTLKDQKIAALRITYSGQ